MDYKFGNKNNWRRWEWNRIAERVPNRSEALTLYLPGELDLDREIALTKGFAAHNLIAVENDSDNLKQLRQRGILCIDGEMSDIISSWPLNRPVSVVSADFCSGLNMKLLVKLKHCWLRPAFNDCVFAFNFLRGRDVSSNEIRDIYADNLKAGLGFYPKTFGHNGQRFSSKHRGFLFFVFMLRTFAFLLEKEIPCSVNEALLASMEVIKQTTLDLNSYRSTSGQMFDSIVFKSPMKEHWLTSESVASTKDIAKGTSSRKRIAAIIAHRTMKIEGILNRARF